MKLNVLRAKLLEGANLAALQTEIDDFLQATGSYTTASPEREFIDVQFQPFGDSTKVWAALVLYTE